MKVTEFTFTKHLSAYSQNFHTSLTVSVPRYWHQNMKLIYKLGPNLWYIQVYIQELAS